MRVTVRLFARLREIAGAGEIACEVPAPATVEDVWRRLVADHPQLSAYTPAVSAARNLEYVRMQAPVAEHDEVAFLPPVSGG